MQALRLQLKLCTLPLSCDAPDTVVPIEGSFRLRSLSGCQDYPTVADIRNPTTGITCCARAATGHAAALPMSVMNSRRRIPNIGFFPNASNAPPSVI
jgi:hypothetical protein